MKIDFHTHTYHSFDSLMKPLKIIEIARSRGLDGIVICDHNTIKGAIEANKINPYKEFRIFVGAEIATDAGDVTGINLKREIVSRNFSEVALEIKSQGGKVILNHPYKGHDLNKVDFTLVDFIEGYNSRLSADLNNKALELALKHNIPVIAGSDSHLYAEIGNCKTSVSDLDSLTPLNFEYQRSAYVNILMSQYIKAWKRKSLKLFLAATLLAIKRLF